MNERLVVEALIAAGRLPLLEAVAALHLPDCWIAAGAVRNAVWDAAHGYVPSTPLNDVDVVWFQPGGSAADDAAIQLQLTEQMPDVRWEVKNQARMHVRQGQPPYRDSSHAMADRKSVV